jgi:hypothetical protein
MHLLEVRDVPKLIDTVPVETPACRGHQEVCTGLANKLMHLRYHCSRVGQET